MNRATSLIASSGLLAFLALQGCAASPGAESNEDDIKASNANALLMSALEKANAPSNTPAGNLGVGSRIARIELTTAQGGIAKFVSEGGEVSTLEGEDLGNVVDLGVNWSQLGAALVSGGAKWQTEQLDHGASSSKLLAKVECSRVVAPGAKPKCTVSPIVVTASNSEALMSVLTSVNAPSNTPAGVLGVGSRIARVTLTTAQGGIAHFISEGISVATLTGHSLGDIQKVTTPWGDVRDALLNGAAVWKTTKGANGASSSTIVATVECKQVVAPGAKPTCRVSPEVGL